MAKSHLLGLVCAVLLGFVTLSSHAALVSRLGGAAAYDDVLDITWVTNASLSGSDTRAHQEAWASSLDYLGFDDWRLASMSVAAGLPTGTTTSVVDCSTATELACRDNELGYMFYQNLGGNILNTLPGNQVVDGVTLTNIQSYYWSGTEFDSNSTWTFFFFSGDQGSIDHFSMYGWAVRSGDVSAVPVPAAIWLFGSGLLGLIGVARRKVRV
jgi:hypothetical protein